jgi:type II secretory pathway pseudopilin PulG
MTLVEVLVALAVVSFVFSSLTQMTFDALKKAKELELQDKMRNYATEASQIIYNEKDTNWKRFSETSLPPAPSEIGEIAKSQAQIFYETDPITNKRTATLKAINETQCTFKDNMFIGQGCLATAPPEGDAKVLFGRLIIRTDKSSSSEQNSYGTTKNTENDAEIQIIVACLEGRCDPKEFQPFILNLKLFRTGGIQ